MSPLSARNVLHGTLPFNKELIDEVLATMPPACMSENEIEMWDQHEVHLALCARTGIKASFFDAPDDDESINADELAEVEAMETLAEARIAAAHRLLAETTPETLVAREADADERIRSAQDRLNQR